MRNSILIVLLVTFLGVGMGYFFSELQSLKKELKSLTKLYGDTLARESQLYSEIEQLGTVLQKCLIVEPKRNIKQ